MSKSKFESVPLEMRQNIYEFVFSGAYVRLFSYRSTSLLPETEKIIDTEKQLAIDSSRVDDALNVLLTCKQIAEEARPILAACTELSLTCRSVDYIPAHIQQYWFARIETITYVPCSTCPLDTQKFPSLKTLHLTNFERLDSCRPQSNEPPMRFLHDRRISRSHVTKIVEGGLDSKLTTATKSAFLDQGSWIEVLIQEPRSSHRLLCDLGGRLEYDSEYNWLYLTYDLRSLEITRRRLYFHNDLMVGIKTWEHGQS
jgi:hypothetical protein